MASESGRSLLLQKYGPRLTKAAAIHQHEEAKTVGYSELPAGINGGIAQVKKCYFDTYKTGDNKGEFFFYAAAVVVSPITFQGEQIVGKMTVLPIEPVCDTPTRSRKTLEEHVSWIQNELKKMGCPTRLLSAENLEMAAEWVRKRKPYIKFRTWKGEKQKTGPYKDREPQIRHEWGGTIIFQESDEALAARAVRESSDNGEDAQGETDVEVVDSEPGEAMEDAREVKSNPLDSPTDHTNRMADVASGDDMTDNDADGAQTEVATVTSLDDATVRSLIFRANNEDQEAIATLGRMAEAVGVPDNQFESASNWNEVYELIKTAMTAREGGETTTITAEQEEVPYVSREEEGEQEAIKAGKIFLLKLTDPKTGKPNKPYRVEVLSVNDQISTVDVKVLGTNRKISKVAWKHLMPLE